MFDFIKRIKKGLDLLEQTEKQEKEVLKRKADYEEKRRMLINLFSTDILNVFVKGDLDSIDNKKRELASYIEIIKKSGCVGNSFSISIDGLNDSEIELKIIFNYIFHSDSMSIIINNNTVTADEELLNKLIKFKNDSKIKGWGTKEERQRFRSLAGGMMSIPDEEFIEKDLAKYQQKSESVTIKNVNNKKGENEMNNREKRIEKLKNTQIITIDAESNGLWGQPFSIAAVVYDENGKEFDRFVGRCPISEEVNDWVEKNVLPTMVDIPVTHQDYVLLLKEFFEFAKGYYKNGATVLTHMGQIVESRLLRDAYDLEIIGDWDAPYQWFDVCLLFGDSVDTYNKENGVEIPPLEGGTHNPLYDAISAYRAFRHFITE